MVFDPLKAIRNRKNQDEQLEELYRKTIYRLDKYCCPYCLAKGDEILLKTNKDDFIECPKCKLVLELFYEPNKRNAVFLGGFIGKGDFKYSQDDLSDLFKDLMILVRKDNNISIIGSSESILEMN